MNFNSPVLHKVSTNGAISGPYFPVYGPKIFPYLETFYAMCNHQKTSDDFRGKRSSLICWNSFNNKSKTLRQFLNVCDLFLVIFLDISIRGRSVARFPQTSEVDNLTNDYFSKALHLWCLQGSWLWFLSNSKIP